MAKNERDRFGALWDLFRALLGFGPIILIFIFGQYNLLILYAVIGLIFFVIGRFFKLLEAKNWLSDLLASVVIWPTMLLMGKEFLRKEKRTYLDELNSIVDSDPIFKMQKEYFSVMSKDGTTEDVVPNGVGRFGYDVTNPIPTNNIFGSNAYLGRLRDKEGNPISFERIGSTYAKNVNNPIDIYKITNSDSKELGNIYVSPYQKTISKKVPEGFIIK